MNTEKLLRQSLNKASIGNKDIIVRNITDIIKDINELSDNENVIKKFINQVFDKCITEPNFIFLYVDIIYELFITIKPLYPDIATKLYRSLINLTQFHFEEEININNRKDKINCTHFISELINKKFINIKISNILIQSLLNSSNQYKIELACILIHKIKNRSLLSKEHYDKLKILSNDKSITQRILFKIADTMEIIKIN